GCGFDEWRDIEAAGVTVRRHAHHLELAIQHLKAEELGHGAVEATEGVGCVEFLGAFYLAAFAIAKPRGAVFADTVDAHDGRIPVTGEMVGARCVCQMMFDGDEL